MSDLNPDPDFVPDPELLDRFPEISGNAVNGLGEAEVRRPSPFFWHPPERETHGELRNYVMDLFMSLRDGGTDWGDVGDRGPEPVAPAVERQTGTAEELTKAVREFAHANEADMLRVTEMNPLWVYEGYAVDEPRLIVLGLAQSYDKMKHAPPRPGNHHSNTEVRRQYNRGARASKNLSNFIRGIGYQATPHFGPDAEALNLIPAALQAGLGELGKHGSIINRENSARTSGSPPSARTCRWYRMRRMRSAPTNSASTATFALRPVRPTPYTMKSKSCAAPRNGTSISINAFPISASGSAVHYAWWFVRGAVPASPKT